MPRPTLPQLRGRKPFGGHILSHETTRATAVCPFHNEVIVRVGDDAAESHAFERAMRVVKSDGSTWDSEALSHELGCQLASAADGQFPRCAAV